MTPLPFMEELHEAARRAEVAETAFRRESSQRIATLERYRAFAFRRVNFMSSIVEAVAATDSEEMAVAHAFAVLRARLGWASDSEARTDVTTRFTPVALAVFAALAPADEDRQDARTAVGNADRPDVPEALAAFETWYADTHTAPFWALFEHYMPETPRVDF